MRKILEAQVARSFTNMWKKGSEDTAQTIKLLIPIVFVLIICTWLADNFLAGGADMNEKNTCKMSVQQQAATKLMTSKLPADISTIPIKCPTQKVTITETDPEKIKSAVAMKMYDCLDNFGKGKLNIFPSDRLMNEVFCVVCSDIGFKDNNQKITGFMKYLVDNNAPLQQDSYYHEFNGVDPTAETYEALASNPTDFIDTSSKYVVVFAYGKSTGLIDRYGKGVSFAIVGGVAVAVISGVFTGGVSWIAILGAGGVLGGYGFMHGTDLPTSYSGSVQLLPVDASDKTALDNLHCTILPNVK
jgi:hypothetical protein